MSELENDGSSQLIVLDKDSVNTQALWVRVGPIYDEDTIRDKPAVWIEYQPIYMESTLQGSMLITPETWDELDKTVREHIARFDKSNYGYKWNK